MIDKCSCRNSCSSKKQGLEYLTKYSFPKKLLVAISVVIIIAMCLRSAEAASIEHIDRLHEHMTKATKDMGSSKPEPVMREERRQRGQMRNGMQSTTRIFHKRRHQGGQNRNGMQFTKEPGSMRRISDDLYENARTKVENVVAFTRDNFDDRRKKLTEPGDYSSGMPLWLPNTNFVDIHFHHKRISRKANTAKSKRIFVFLIKELYKSLLEYLELFKIFKQVEVVSPDTQVTSYKIRRDDFFIKTTEDLNSTIGYIKDAMISVKMPEPKINLSQKKLDSIHSIEMRVDAAKYLKNDVILLRAYGNLLDKWFLEFNCSHARKSGRIMKVTLHKCQQYDRNLREKRNKRKKNKLKKQHS